MGISPPVDSDPGMWEHHLCLMSKKCEADIWRDKIPVFLVLKQTFLNRDAKINNDIIHCSTSRLSKKVHSLLIIEAKSQFNFFQI